MYKEINFTNIKDLENKVFSSVYERDGTTFHFVNSDEHYVIFKMIDAVKIIIDDIEGDISDLENSPILSADVALSHSDNTIKYTFTTIKGSVCLLLYGDDFIPI